MYIVCFNGPPYSGKDTMARMLADHMDSQQVAVPTMVVSLSMPLRRIAFQMIGETYNPARYKAFKETKFEQFGVTGRQLMIDVSEKLLKPCYGSAIMVKMLLRELQGFTGVALIADSGFQCEIDPLINAVGAANLYVARVQRDGCSFADDSREWVYHDFDGDYLNNGTLDDLKTEAGRIYGRLVNNLGWRL